LVLVDEAGVSGDDEEPPQSGKSGDDVLGDAVAEIFLLGIATEVGEGEHGNRRLVLALRRPLLGSRAIAGRLGLTGHRRAAVWSGETDAV
jgi:hypothetical protein